MILHVLTVLKLDTHGMPEHEQNQLAERVRANIEQLIEDEKEAGLPVATTLTLVPVLEVDHE